MDKQIKLDWYKTFKEIYQTQTITEAANKLNMTQPAVSLQLNNFENVLNKKLFIRKPRKMIPTEYAKIIYSQIVDLIDKLDNIELLIENNNLKIINIGCPYEFFDSFLLDKLPLKDFKVNFEFGLAYELLSKLKSKDLDMVISTKKINEFNLIYNEIFIERLLLVGNVSLDLTKLNKFIIENDYDEIENHLLELDCFSFSSDLPLIKRFWKNNFNKRPINLIPKVIVPNLNSIIKLLANNNNAFSVIPDYLCKQNIENNLIKEIWKGKKISCNKIYLCFNENFEYTEFFYNFLKNNIDSTKTL